MSKLKLADILKEVLNENYGPDQPDMVPVSQIYHDIYNQMMFNSNSNPVSNYDEERGYVLFSDEEKLKKGQQAFDGKFGGDINKFNSWKKKHNVPKGRDVRYVDMNIT